MDTWCLPWSELSDPSLPHPPREHALGLPGRTNAPCAQVVARLAPASGGLGQ